MSGYGADESNREEPSSPSKSLENPDSKVDDPSSTTEPEREVNVKIFSTSRPKDAFDGVGKGVGNILKGTLGGAALILSAPVAGGNQTFRYHPYHLCSYLHM